MLKKLSLLVGTTALALAAASPALAGRGNADEPLPFEFEYEITEPTAPSGVCDAHGIPAGYVPVGPRLEEVGFNAQGRASHLGRFDASVEFCLYVNESSQPKSIGAGMFTAANGDTLTVVFDGTPIDEVSATAVVIPAMTTGTGRFAEAIVTGDGFAGATGGWLEGTIAYDASDRSNR